MLTERQAWLKIAKAFERGGVGRFVNIDGLLCSGICPAIGNIASVDIEDDMLDKINKHAPPKNFGPEGEHRWPEGDFASRAAFCRKMAALCKPAKRKAKV